MGKKPSNAPSRKEDLSRFKSEDGSNSFGVDFSTYREWTEIRNLESITTVDKETAALLAKKTNNPVWIWMSFAFIKDASDVSQFLLYFKIIGADFLHNYSQHLVNLERKTLVVDEADGESFRRVTPPKFKRNDILRVFGFSQPGKNPFAQAAKDYRCLSVYRQVEDDLKEKRFETREQAIINIAENLGRNSAESGPAVASIKRFYQLGKKLMESS